MDQPTIKKQWASCRFENNRAKNKCFGFCLKNKDIKLCLSECEMYVQKNHKECLKMIL